MTKKKNKKVAFPKHLMSTVFDCNENEIMGLSPDQEKDHLTITFWRNPSKHVLSSLVKFMLATDVELREKSDDEVEILLSDFYTALSEIVIETNIDGLDFSTPEQAEHMFLESPDLPWGFVYEAVASWLLNFMQESIDLKKILRLLGNPSNSGQEKKQKAQDSEKA